MVMMQPGGEFHSNGNRTEPTYLCIVHLAGAEESVQRVIRRNDEPSRVHEELAANVEEDQEEIDAGQAKEDVDLGHRGLLLEVIDHRVLGELGFAK